MTSTTRLDSGQQFVNDNEMKNLEFSNIENFFYPLDGGNEESGPRQ